MTFAQALVLLGYILEAAKVVPAIAALIKRVENGETVTKEEVTAALSKMDQAVQEFDNTPDVRTNDGSGPFSG